MSLRVPIAVALLLSALWSSSHAAPRTAVMSAFEPELALLRARMTHASVQRVNGVEFTTGELQGRPVVLLLAGISMVNAAMNTQLVLDRFEVNRIVFSGVAGGVNPALHIGDVTVPERWSPYLESVFARETAPGVFAPPPWMKDATLPAFGMMHPRPVEVRRGAADHAESREWFEVDARMLGVARTLQGIPLQRCKAANAMGGMDDAGTNAASGATGAATASTSASASPAEATWGRPGPADCLAHEPKLVVGGNGVSGQAFVDNAKFREYAFNTFHANVLDMETAAVAQVAYANGVPMIAFRSLSDLAGGGEGENEIGTFLQIAADNSARVVMAFLKALPTPP